MKMSRLQHEDASAEMFDHLLEENGLLSEPFFEVEENRAFIKEMITGKPVPLARKPSGQVCSCLGSRLYMIAQCIYISIGLDILWKRREDELFV